MMNNNMHTLDTNSQINAMHVHYAYKGYVLMQLNNKKNIQNARMSNPGRKKNLKLRVTFANEIYRNQKHQIVNANYNVSTCKFPDANMVATLVDVNFSKTLPSNG